MIREELLASDERLGELYALLRVHRAKWLDGTWKPADDEPLRVWAGLKDVPVTSLPSPCEFIQQCAAFQSREQGINPVSIVEDISDADLLSLAERMIHCYLHLDGHELCWEDVVELHRLLPECRLQPSTRQMHPDFFGRMELCLRYRRMLEGI